MRYDTDIIIIGAGPAGMAAAIRARWVRTAAALPASVVMLDPAGCGGIAALGSICLTGPGFTFSGPELVARLTDDIVRLEIPVLHEAAVEVTRDDDIWQVRTPARTLRSLAVVVAVGLRRLSDEAAMRAEGKLDFLSGGYARAAGRFRHWSAVGPSRHLVIVGGESLSLADYQRADAGRNSIEAVCEPGQLVRGYRITGEQVVVTVEEAGCLREIACDHVMLDYHSLELAPPAPAFLPPAWRDAAGYCAPAEAGLFAAGDCAGPPSLCLTALARGAEAGFAAYRYVYQRKFGQAPDLFAFYPSPERPDFAAAPFPVLDPARHYPVGLTAASRFPRLLRSGSEAGEEHLDEEIAAKVATVHLR